VAPSNNFHTIPAFAPVGAQFRDEFVANYPGLGQVAAATRPGQGIAFPPIKTEDDPTTPHLQENLYTKVFAGTSGAAPVVTGVVGLMLSVNPNLTAMQVRQILMGTADKDLDPKLDLELELDPNKKNSYKKDSNLQGKYSGEFINGRSLFFGSGKVNAFKAVARAKALFNSP